MSDDNVRRFPKLGLVGPSEDPPDTAAEAPEEASAAPDSAPAEPSPRGRRSPLESIAAMASPGLSDPVVTTAEHSPSAPGHVPGTFRPAGFHDGAQAPQPGLGTLSVATVLAVAVAAMRGIHGAITGVRANREQRKAAADLAASGRGDGTGRKGRMQSAADFGRGFLGRPDRSGGWPRSGAGQGGRGGAGGGRGSGSGGFSGWGGGSSSRRSSSMGADGLTGRKSSNSGSGGVGGRGGRSGGGGGPSGGDRESRTSSNWWRGGSKRTSQRGTGSRRSRRGGTDTSADLTPDQATGAGGTFPKGGGRGRTRSPKAGTAPKGTLRPKKGRAAGTGGGPGTPGKTPPGKKAPGSTPGGKTGPGGAGTPPRRKNGKPVTDGSVRLPKGHFHGTVPGWNQGCRCPGCTRAWAKAQTVVGRKVKLPAGVKHGSATAYEDAECSCRRCVKAAIRRNNARPQDRVTLGRTVGDTLERRWAKRRRNQTPVITTLSKKKRKKAAANKGKARTAATSAAGPKPTGAPPPHPKAGTPGPGPGGPSKHTGHGGGRWSRDQRRAQQRWEQRRAAHAAPDDDFWFAVGPHGMRRTPWESAGAAAAGARPETITIERMDNVGDQELRHFKPKPAPRAAALGPAEPRNSSTGRKESSMSLPDRVMSGLVTGMSSEHATEVTLDDTLETLERLTVESFAAHETSASLAEEARRIRYALEDLAADLRTRHNLIGRLTAAAMERLAESMEILARKAEEMKVASLDAAELSEAAENAMFDAYKPVQQATADAGLAVPSARAHNEG
ncbi:hypothetical protein [Streptacidiphilus neutrinimicus]|uniref:hypothetical protein n=1 Tax=Streptacidiphilus neutrinimicus TaxID=105420 RepID=UPI0005A8EE67|nr:hypothetical protein [Streptacidiphilus neutrinimicus]